MDDTIGVGLAAFGMSGCVFHAPLLKNNPHFRIRRVMERSKNEANRFLPGIPMAFYDNLHDCIARSGEIAVKPEDAANVIRIIEAAQKSDTEGRTVRLSRP